MSNIPSSYNSVCVPSIRRNMNGAREIFIVECYDK